MFKYIIKAEFTHKLNNFDLNNLINDTYKCLLKKIFKIFM